MRLALLPIVGAVGIWLLGEPNYAHLGWGLLIGVAIGVVLYIPYVLSPPDLLLSPEGFRLAGLRGRSWVAWRDVDRFWVLRLPSGSYILYGGGGPRRTKPGLWVFRGLPSEADGYIPNGMVIETPALLALLNDWKARYGG